MYQAELMERNNIKLNSDIVFKKQLKSRKRDLMSEELYNQI